MKLMRFKDNTFVWLSNETDMYISPVLNEKEAIAFGTWNLKILKTEVILGISNLKTFGDMEGKKDNVAIFGDTKKLYLYTTKQGEAK
jgi:hypothetical protein